MPKAKPRTAIIVAANVMRNISIGVILLCFRFFVNRHEVAFSVQRALKPIGMIRNTLTSGVLSWREGLIPHPTLLKSFLEIRAKRLFWHQRHLEDPTRRDNAGRLGRVRDEERLHRVPRGLRASAEESHGATFVRATVRYTQATRHTGTTQKGTDRQQRHVASGQRITRM